MDMRERLPRCPGGVIGPNQLSKCGGVVTLKHTPLTRPWPVFVNDKCKENVPNVGFFVVYFALIAPSILLVCVVLSRCMQLLLSPLVHLSAWQKCLLLVGG